ncbi:MAG: glycoside hydrolase family 3 N-terminal domain-containing protein [Saprospiraceae bacterium]|nr:glycoside hydrolase family 3 N-terminal domain-containing protein [Saprospiraceae bacterium]
MKFPLLTLLCLSLFFTQGAAQMSRKAAADLWVDETYKSMSDTARIGQLFMIRAHSNLGEDHIQKVMNEINRYQIGGLCFFQGTPEKQAYLTNKYQKLSKIPLFVSMDAEWGLNMRLKESTIAFPKQMMLGAIQDNNLIYRFGLAVAQECKRLGVHINFAPDADVNSNPRNPVINERSFGEDKLNVAAKAFQYMKGMQDNGVMACAKHFPGHGDTEVDSHLDLPLITHDMARLTDVELMPFRVLSQQGIGSVMVSHLQVNAIDATVNTPSTLSRYTIKSLLRESIGYQGLVFTDGMEMKGLTKFYPSGEASARAIEAGNDILLLPENTASAIEWIRKYRAEGRITEQDLEMSVKRILRAKYEYGLATPQYVEPTNIRSELNSYESRQLKRDLIQNALTLVRNEDNILPFLSFQPDSVASLAMGAGKGTSFQYQLNQLGVFNQFNIGKSISEEKKKFMLAYFSKKKTVIVSLHDMKQKASEHFGLSEDVRNFVNALAQRTQVILVVFGNPYALKYFDDIKNIVECYNEDKITQELAAQGLFGTFTFKGKLPVTASERAKCGMGFSINTKINRLKWNTDFPEEVGMNAANLAKIDDVANELIDKGAAPSCQILVAKEGQVVYHKAFGYHTYDKTQAATTEDLYDLASITKCAATTLSLMKLYEEGQVDLDENYEKYLPILRGSNKADLQLKDVLTHRARLPAWIPFYKNTMEAAIVDGKKRLYPSSQWYANVQTDEYPTEVAKNFFLKRAYLDSIIQHIAEVPLRNSHHYFYSDLGMMLMAFLVKNVSGLTLDAYAETHFYTPLSMSRTLFNPLRRFAESEITPSEEDNYFRMQQIRGHVHDMAAAMLGGVSGHAGLFSTSRDLAVLLQMLLNGGEYAGIRYLKPETIAYFTQRQGGSTRRAYGWDMKELNAQKRDNMSDLASSNTYGHTAFTGDAMYVDPDKQLIYIFLSNRTYPSMNNNKLINGNYRARIQTLIYEAIKGQ